MASSPCCLVEALSSARDDASAHRILSVARVNEPVDGRAPMFDAAAKGLHQCVSWLLGAGAAVDRGDDNGGASVSLPSCTPPRLISHYSPHACAHYACAHCLPHAPG